MGASRQLELALLKACRMDVVAFKPGNVSLCADGHGMHAGDFLISAKAAVPQLCQQHLPVGERILRAIRGTHEAVGCNTNLGIVLLLAPLAQAAGEHAGGSLRAALEQGLERLTVADTIACFEAIRVAKPAGLGQADEQDVDSVPSLGLKQVMEMAADRDSVALQYATVFDWVFERGQAVLTTYLARWHSLAWATTACYLHAVCELPDSHVARKYGKRRAEQLSQRFEAVVSLLKACENPRRLAGHLTALDRELKRGNVNPGTSADLTVASVAVLLLQQRFHSKC